MTTEGLKRTMNYHRSIQALVAYMETLRERLKAKGYDLQLSPMGQLTIGGSLGVKLWAQSLTAQHTFEVEDAGAADYYVTVTVDGVVRSKSDHLGGDPRIAYGGDLLAFMRPHIETFIKLL